MTARERLRKVAAYLRGYTRRIRDQLQRMPLAYKLSFFITVLVVSCMILLGVILSSNKPGCCKTRSTTRVIHWFA